MVEFGRRDIDQKKNQYPDLDRGKAMPRKGRGHVRQKLAHRMVLDQPEPDEVFEEPRDEYDGPIKDRLEQDGLDHWPAVVAAQHRHRVGDQHRFADDECGGGGEHKVAKGNRIVGEDQVGRQHNQVKADEKEYRRRQHFAEFVQNEGASPPREPCRCTGRRGLNLATILRING